MHAFVTKERRRLGGPRVPILSGLLSSRADASSGHASVPQPWFACEALEVLEHLIRPRGRDVGFIEVDEPVEMIASLGMHIVIEPGTDVPGERVVDVQHLNLPLAPGGELLQIDISEIRVANVLK